MLQIRIFIESVDGDRYDRLKRAGITHNDIYLAGIEAKEKEVFFKKTENIKETVKNEIQETGKLDRSSGT